MAVTAEESAGGGIPPPELPAFTMIRAQVTERIGWLTLNRPERRNALSPDMLTEIVACLQAWEQSTSVNVVVIGAEGPHFSAGLDRDWIQSDSSEERRTLQFASSRFHRELFELRIPSIAMVHGAAVGTGMDVAVLCDFRVASDDAVFGHPEIISGGPPLFTPLRSVVGDGWARELCLTGRTITAAEAERIGLVNPSSSGPRYSRRQPSSPPRSRERLTLRWSPRSPSSAPTRASTPSSIPNTTSYSKPD